jgi:hypothetical protein
LKSTVLTGASTNLLVLNKKQNWRQTSTPCKQSCVCLTDLPTCPLRARWSRWVLHYLHFVVTLGHSVHYIPMKVSNVTLSLWQSTFTIVCCQYIWWVWLKIERWECCFVWRCMYCNDYCTLFWIKTYHCEVYIRKLIDHIPLCYASIKRIIKFQLNTTYILNQIYRLLCSRGNWWDRLYWSKLT